jgi:hypothetical protein
MRTTTRLVAWKIEYADARPVLNDLPVICQYGGAREQQVRSNNSVVGKTQQGARGVDIQR